MVFAAAWLGCTDDGSGPDDTGQRGVRNGLSVGFALDDAPDGFDALVLRVDQVVLDGVGPSGPQTVSAEVAQTYALLGGAREDVVLELEVGPWRDVTITVELAEGPEGPEGAGPVVPAIFAAGDLEDGGRFELHVRPTFAFTGRGAFELGAGLDPRVVFELEPDDWLDDVQPTADPHVVSPDENAADYAAALAEIRASTEVVFPGQGDD